MTQKTGWGKIGNDRFIRGFTKWDKLLFLFNLPFLFPFLLPGIQPDCRIILAAIIAIIGIIVTTIASYWNRTSYTTWPNLVWPDTKEEIKKKKKKYFNDPGEYKGKTFDKLRHFYEKDVMSEVEKLKTELSDPTKPSKEISSIENTIKMLENKKKWNNTQWELFRDWYDKKKPNPGKLGTLEEDIIQEMMAAEIKKSEDQKSNQFSVIFGAFFSFIAGWAVVQTIITFSQSQSLTGEKNFLSFVQGVTHLNLTTPDLENLLIFISFYPIAIVFYHSGAIFINSDAQTMMTGGRKSRTFFNIGIILLDGIILYFMSERASNQTPGSFISLVLLLMVLSVGWVFLFRYLDNRDSKVDWPIYMEWLHFDLFILIFCGIFLLYFNGSPEDIIPYLCMFLVFVAMAICNYQFAWNKLWSKITPQGY